MKIHPKFTFPLILSIIVSSISCQTPNPAGGNPSNQQTPAASGQQSSPLPTATVNTAQTEPAKAILPQSQTLDLQTNHPNGSVLRVTRVNFSDDSISLDFAVTNGYSSEIKLAQGGMQMRDNIGNVYNLSPPAQDPDIKVASNNSLQGKLTFLGRISPSATSLVLTTNYRYSSNSGAYDTTPKMVISNIPVQR